MGLRGRRAEFLAWAHRTESVTRVLNPAAVLERNTDKTYLRDLAVPSIPDLLGRAGGGRGLPVLDEYVVKPSISAGARDTIRTRDRKEAEAHAARLAAGGADRDDPAVPGHGRDRGGDLAAVLRRPVQSRHPAQRDAGGERHQAGPGERPRGAPLPEPDQFALAERVLGEFPEVLYARVDLVRLADGARLSSRSSSPSRTCSCGTRPGPPPSWPAPWPRRSEPSPAKLPAKASASRGRGRAPRGVIAAVTAASPPRAGRPRRCAGPRGASWPRGARAGRAPRGWRP